jgi:hypothetical protein
VKVRLVVVLFKSIFSSFSDTTRLRNSQRQQSTSTPFLVPSSSSSPINREFSSFLSSRSCTDLQPWPYSFSPSPSPAYTLYSSIAQRCNNFLPVFSNLLFLLCFSSTRCLFAANARRFPSSQREQRQKPVQKREANNGSIQLHSQLLAAYPIVQHSPTNSSSLDDLVHLISLFSFMPRYRSSRTCVGRTTRRKMARTGYLSMSSRGERREKASAVLE